MGTTNLIGAEGTEQHGLLHLGPRDHELAQVSILVHGHLIYRLGKMVTNWIHLKQINKIEKRTLRYLNSSFQADGSRCKMSGKNKAKIGLQ